MVERPRRYLLRVGSVALAAGLAGCPGGGGDDRNDDDRGDDETPVDEPEGHVRPDGDPAHFPDPLECEESEFQRHRAGVPTDDPVWGDLEAADGVRFSLRVDRLSVAVGDEARVDLTNRTDTDRSTRTKATYDLEVRTSEGWEEVRGWRDGEARPYPDEEVTHPPGEGFSWTLRMDEGEIDPDHPHRGHLVVCPGLPEGRYRFVYWGTDDPVAVAFDLEG